jgi:hypothetical protein
VSREVNLNKMDGGEESAPGRISLRKLDQLLAGELPEAEAERLRAALADSPPASEFLAESANWHSRLSLEKILRSRRGVAPWRDRAKRAWNFAMGVHSGAGVRRIGFATAFLCVLGAGIWNYGLRELGGDGRWRAKGGVEAGVRLSIQGTEYDSGQLVSAHSGDTLGVVYRSSVPLFAQIWYREEGGAAQPMEGLPGGSVDWSWPRTTGWRPAHSRIILDGNWRRQTVWVIWSPLDFTAEEAGKAIAGRSSRADLRLESFRLTVP